MNQNKLKAFTLLQLLIAMVVSGVLFLLINQLWFRAVEGYYTYRDNSGKYNELSRWKDILEDDFFESQKVLLTNNGIICYLADGKQIAYTFSGELLREAEGESWELETEQINVQVYYQGQIQKETGGLVDGLVLEIKNPDDKEGFVWNIHKNYGADDFEWD